MKYLYIFIISLTFANFGAAQVDYANCQTAFQILDPIDWCSADAGFNNINVGASGYGPASCWNNADNDVWFEFTAFATAVNLVISGNGAGNTLSNPQVALYTGSCGGTINELQCEVAGGITNLFETGLIIGQKYLIRINGADDDQGAFKICINNYNPPVDPGQDCITGSILCDKSPFVVQAVSGAGADSDEAAGSCLGNFGQQSENQSTWFKWTASTSGTLTFIITPLNPSDDLDFVLYEITNTDGTCAKTQLRCMATSCQGPTGLDLTSTDLEEDLNCEANEDGFVRFIDMIAGNSYALMVNNFSNTGVGFNMEWGGTGDFLGPDPEFLIVPDSLECDQEFMVINTSSSPNGINIIDFAWTFGERAVPLTSPLENPGPVSYEKFGQKFVVLQVTTDKGCIVTEVEPIYAEPCCEDLEQIGINELEVIDLICPGIPEGSFTIGGFGGSPEYEYDLNQSGIYTETTSFGDLFAGSYQVNIIDIKGCEDSIIVQVDEPLPTTPDAGSDQTTVLGFSANLDGSWFPLNSNVDIVWTSDPTDDNMSCYDCPNPIVFPPGTTTYYMQITDENGCVAIDSVVVRVKLERPIYAPNVFTPNNDGSNDFFNIFTNRAAEKVNLLRVYDRWGELVYEGIDVPINDEREGWDGQHNGLAVVQGVYAWYAQITFIDDITVDFKGDVTVLR